MIGIPESDNGGGFDQHYVGDAIEAWAKALDTHGGIGGRPVKLKRCNDQGTTTGATQCSRTQVEDSSIVLGTGFSPFMGAIQGPEFLKAGIPFVPSYTIGPSQLDGTGSSRDVVPATLAALTAGPEYAARTLHAKKFAIIRLDLPSLAALDTLFHESVTAAGATVVSDLKVPLTTADFSASVLQAKAAGAEVILPVLTIPDQVKLIQTLPTLGFTGTIELGAGVYNKDIQKAIDVANVRAVTTADFPDPNGSDPATAAYRTAMTAAGFGSEISNSEAEDGWATAHYFEKVFSAIGAANITRSAVADFLKTRTVSSVPMFSGLVGAMNATGSLPALGYAKTYIVTISPTGEHYESAPTSIAAAVARLRPPW